MMSMQDSTEAMASIYVEMQNLSSAVHEHIIEQRKESMLKETDEVIKWLSPVNSSDDLARVCNDQLPGTGQWIWDGQFAVWEDGTPTTQPIFWIGGKCEYNPSIGTNPGSANDGLGSWVRKNHLVLEHTQ
jgi:hypothetical protein